MNFVESQVRSLGGCENVAFAMSPRRAITSWTYDGRGKTISVTRSIGQ